MAFIKALIPFPGQHATVVICGQDDTERFGFEQLLLDLLRKAQWENLGYKRWDSCPTKLNGGSDIFFVSASDTTDQWLKPYSCRGTATLSGKGVDAAGKVLCDVLSKLRIQTAAWIEAPLHTDIATRDLEISRARKFWADGASGSPAELALEEPTTIFILVGPK